VDQPSTASRASSARILAATPGGIGPAVALLCSTLSPPVPEYVRCGGGDVRSLADG